MVLVKICPKYLEHAANHELALCSRSGVQLDELQLAPLYLSLVVPWLCYLFLWEAVRVILGAEELV
jgi:hypothetical protein